MFLFMWYLLIGAFWAVICKATGAIDITIDDDKDIQNNLLVQILVAVAIILFWVPVILYGFFGGKDE